MGKVIFDTQASIGVGQNFFMIAHDWKRERRRREDYEEEEEEVVVTLLIDNKIRIESGLQQDQGRKGGKKTFYGLVKWVYMIEIGERPRIDRTKGGEKKK